MTCGLSALIYATWRTGRGRGSADWAPVAALWMLAMFWVSPMMRHYYLALAFPAVAVVWRTMVAELQSRGGRWQTGIGLAAMAMAAWLAGVFCLGWDVGRWYGLHLGVVALLMAATIWAWQRALDKELIT